MNSSRMGIDNLSLSFYLLDIKERTEVVFYQLSDAICFQRDRLTTSHENIEPLLIQRSKLILKFDYFD